MKVNEVYEIEKKSTWRLYELQAEIPLSILVSL
jgi:hypothetical protein